jgi:uncharacterized protein (TIGR02996 family)
VSDPEQALLAAIRDARDGDDDGPRRAYADWLIERDDARGAYIRLALAPGASHPFFQDETWQGPLLPAALDACDAWEARFGGRFSLMPDDFERGLPSRVQLQGPFGELVAHATLLAAMTAQDLEVDTDDEGCLARRDWRVVATVSWSDWWGARAREETARVRVHSFPSLDVIAERAHRYCRYPTPSGQPRALRFARHADELCYRVDERTEVLPFVLPR